MKFARIVSLAVLIAGLSTSQFSQDLKPDPSFNPVFNVNDRVHDVVVLADGKLMIGGAMCGNTGTSSCTPIVRRLNVDGTVDTAFNAAFGMFPQVSSYIGTINRLSNGQYFVSGRMSVGGQSSNYARLNADGSVDTTLALGVVGFSYNPKFLPTPDGKYVGCGERTINSQLHDVAHRINADGTPDPTFRVTFTDGFCKDIEVLPNGKILISVGTDFGQNQVKQLVRLNSDGSQDLAFDADIPVGSYQGRIAEFKSLPDGKVLMTYSYPGTSDNSFRRLNSNGSTDVIYPLCSGGSYLTESNGNMLAYGCKRWSGSNYRPSISRVFPDGSVDTKFDNLFLEGAYGMREAGNGGYYAFGTFTSTQFNSARQKLVRLIPENTPPRAKFDFDGDGRSDLAVFRASDRTWYLNQSTNGFQYTQWGFGTDAMATGHYDNDGKTDIGVFRDGILHAFSAAFGHRQIFIGQTGDRPILGNFEDYNGNLGDFMVRGSRDYPAVWIFRDGNTAANPIGGSTGAFTLPEELSTDKPVIGDFNGDSREEIGFFRDGYWYTRDYASVQAAKTFQWGVAGDIPVPGDYDGDRQDDIAIFRPSNGQWWINRSSLGMIAIAFGQNGDIPVPADYDGDGKQDIAIYRNGQWWQFLIGSGTVRVDQWGVAGDKPVQAQMQ